MTLWHYPVSKLPESSLQRQQVTDWYAFVTGTTIGSLLLIGLPCWAILGPRLNLPTVSRFSIFRRIGEALKLLWIFYHLKSLAQITFWLLVLTPLLILGLNGDLIYLAKRVGKIPVVCLPPVLFLTMRPSPLPKVLYLSLLPIHKWLLRLIIFQLIIHVIIYLGYFQFKNTWLKMYKLENIWGWIALLGFVVIAVTLILPLRHRNYRLFFVNHYVFLWIIVICLQFHARPTKVTLLTIMSLSILIGQIAYRLFICRTSNEILVTNILPNLAIVSFPSDRLAVRGNCVGGHIRIAIHSRNIFRHIFSELCPDFHPYTLVSLPLDEYQKLVIKKGRFELNEQNSYDVCGIYDSHLQFIKSTSTGTFSISRLTVAASRVLLVVGGLAILFALPIARVLGYHGIPLKIIWVVRDFRDVIVLRHFVDSIQTDDFEIFITGEPIFEEIVDIEVGCSSEEEEYPCDDLTSTVTDTLPLLRRKLSTHTLNLSFTLPAVVPKYHRIEFDRTISELSLKNRVYKGRPTLNHRYKDWCANENSFTQCSGPVIRDDEMVCCREMIPPEMPSLNKSIKNCWVVSAGPRELVRNTSLWAAENGLNFHEESFTV